jgi:hypothetical protein
MLVKFVKSIVLTAAVLAMTAAPSVAGTTCAERLAEKTYFCNVKSSFGTEFNDCFEFGFGGSQLVISALDSDPLVCECAVKSSFSRPQFEVGQKHTCVTSAADHVTGFSYIGKASGNGRKIRNMQGISETGDTFIMNCEQVEACPTLRNEGNPWTSQ